MDDSRAVSSVDFGQQAEDACSQAEAAKRRAERRVELLSAFARGIICEFDEECRYKDVWTTDESLLAMPTDQLLGRTIVEALGEEIGRPLQVATARVYATGLPETREYTLELPVGPRAFEAQIVRIRPEGDAEPYRAAALIRDVTEEKELERKLAEAERLASLGVLAAGIGHEINNPLMIVQENVRWVAEALRTHGKLPRERRDADLLVLSERLDDALDGVERMQQIVGDLRLFRQEEGRELAALDIRSSVHSAIAIAQGQIEQRALLERDLSAVPLTAASEGKLVQVFLNLLINATQSIQKGDPRSQRIRVTTRTDARGWAVAEISDTGCGIPPSELPRIFDPFFTTKREGMGLGLSVCQRIVRDYGGSLTVESEVGRGTTFRLNLPPHVSQGPHAPAPASRAETVPSRRLRLLVIDDKAALVRILEMTLRKDHEVVTAQSGDESLGILSKDARFDAILCDLMMPLGDGMTFYEQLGRAHPELKERVIFMTGGAFTERARSFLESVPNKTIGKPFTPESLRGLLAELAARTR
jgi:signal transduction histidine kinase